MTTLPPVAADLGWTLGAVLRAYLTAAEQVLVQTPGGPRGYQVLAVAAGEGCSSQLALAHGLGIDRTVMTYLLDDLAAAGLVERTPDPADRRARRIVTTPAGRARLAELDCALRGVEDGVLAVLDAEERELLRSLLRRVATQYGAPEDTPCPDTGPVGPGRVPRRAARPATAAGRRRPPADGDHGRAAH